MPEVVEEVKEPEVTYAQPHADATNLLFLRGRRKQIGPLKHDELTVNNNLLRVVNQFAMGLDMTQADNRLAAFNFTCYIGAVLYYPKPDSVDLLKNSVSREQLGQRMKVVFFSDIHFSMQEAFPGIAPLSDEVVDNIYDIWEDHTFVGLYQAWGIDKSTLVQ